MSMIQPICMFAICHGNIPGTAASRTAPTPPISFASPGFGVTQDPVRHGSGDRGSVGDVGFRTGISGDLWEIYRKTMGKP